MNICCLCGTRMPRGHHLNGSGWTIVTPKGGRSHRACPQQQCGEKLGRHVDQRGKSKEACVILAIDPSIATKQISAALPTTVPEPTELSPDEVKALVPKAIAWAYENGFKGVLITDEPTKMAYPQRGHGWAVLVREESGTQRRATARFNHAGNPTYWSMDGGMVL